MAGSGNQSRDQEFKLASLARDLRVQAPRSVFAPLGPIPAVAARTVDKCRAELAGTAGSYHYNCPLDRQFLGFSGIDAEALKAKVATGADDQELADWMLRNASRRPAAAIIAWGKRFRLNPLLRVIDLDDWLHTHGGIDLCGPFMKLLKLRLPTLGHWWPTRRRQSGRNPGAGS